MVRQHLFHHTPPSRRESRTFFEAACVTALLLLHTLHPAADQTMHAQLAVSLCGGFPRTSGKVSRLPHLRQRPRQVHALPAKRSHLGVSVKSPLIGFCRPHPLVAAFPETAPFPASRSPTFLPSPSAPTFHLRSQYGLLQRGHCTGGPSFLGFHLCPHRKHSRSFIPYVHHHSP